MRCKEPSFPTNRQGDNRGSQSASRYSVSLWQGHGFPCQRRESITYLPTGGAPCSNDLCSFDNFAASLFNFLNFAGFSIRSVDFATFSTLSLDRKERLNIAKSRSLGGGDRRARAEPDKDEGEKKERRKEREDLKADAQKD